MSERDPLQKLGEFEAANRSTKPLYDEWANTYENDLVNNLGYSAHKIAADALADLVPYRDATIVDIGCGTGLVGQELVRHGFTLIDGIDISADMIAHAGTKGIYRELLTGDMNQRTTVPDARYDAAICAGSFAPGHLGPESYLEIIRMVKPGAPIVIFMNGVHFLAGDYDARIKVVEQDGLWTCLSIGEHNYMSARNRPGRLILTRKCQGSDVGMQDLTG